MSIKSTLAKSLGRASYWALSKFTNGGSSFPGKLAQQIDPKILSHLAKDYDVAIITGTNGKTLTTSLATKALRAQFPNVITNDTGSNMVQGIISTFLMAQTLPRGQKGMAILEVDEGSLKNVVPHVHPKFFVHTNIFEDQLDRYGTIEDIYQKLVDAAGMAPEATIISNADCHLLQSKPLANPMIYFGFSDAVMTPGENEATANLRCPHTGEDLVFTGHSYGPLGNYHCPQSDFKRPDLDVAITSIDHVDMAGSQFTINDQALSIPVAGQYNIYNALAAYSLARAFDVDHASIADSFNQIERVFGRQEEITIQGKSILLNLVKNPVGFNEVLRLMALEEKNFDLITLFNNNNADGTDISWIHETDIASLKSLNIDQIYHAGMVKEDLMQAFQQAGFDSDKMQMAESFEDILTIIEISKQDQFHILASYTATLAFRKLLMDKGYLNA